MSTNIQKAYESDPIENELKHYSPKELRHAANCLDREKGKFPPINALSLSRKLDALDATLHYVGQECGRIEFFLKNKGSTVTRHFQTISELTTAINLGPIDLFWHGNLFIKMTEGVFIITIKNLNTETHKMNVWIPELKLSREIYINGAEKVLCNTKRGLTAGQLKLLIKETIEI